MTEETSWTTAARLIALAALLGMAGCSDNGSQTATPPTPVEITPPVPPKPIVGVTQTVIAKFTAPWSVKFLPDGRLLVTDNSEKSLSIVTQAGQISDVSGLPDRFGMYDVALSPFYASDKTIYITYSQPSVPSIGPTGDPNKLAGVLALASGQVKQVGLSYSLINVKVLWHATPGLVGVSEWGGRIAFSPDAKYLFLAVGDRSAHLPAKALDNTLGKIIRLSRDGTIPPDNPYVGAAGALPEIWTAGHRNQYGLAFAPDGRLWESENGPKGGDEFNLIVAGQNYGWPTVSYGDDYDGTPIQKPAAGDGFATAVYFWTPAIAPAGMIFYNGPVFADWNGDVVLTGLLSKALIRVHITGDTAAEVQRIDMGVRTRDIVEAPDGALWVLTDTPNGALVKLAPIF